ncbi:MAG: hypothetical protein RLO03_12000 [Balneola sp.]
MKMKTLSVALLILFISSSVYSQNRQRQNTATPPPVEERVKTTLEKITSEITLSKEQQESSKEIFTNFFTSIDRLRTSGGRPDRNKMDSISRKRDKEFETLLTPEQKKKYVKINDELFSRPRRVNQ